MRQIEDVTSTQDGCHLLILLTDGGTLYFRAGLPEPEAEAGDGVETKVDPAHEATTATLKEFSKLSYSPSVDSSWTIRRVGASGTVVLLRATRQDNDECLTELSICPLSGMFFSGTVFLFYFNCLLSDEAPGEVGDTRVKNGLKWNSWDWCCHTQAMVDAARELKAEQLATAAKTKETNCARSGKPPLSRKGSKKNLPSLKKEEKALHPTPLKSHSRVDYQTPGSSGVAPSHISPADVDEKVQRPAGSSQKARKKRSLLATPVREGGSVEMPQESRSVSAPPPSAKRRRHDANGPAMASPVTSMTSTPSSFQNSGPCQLYIFLICLIC